MIFSRKAKVPDVSLFAAEIQREQQKTRTERRQHYLVTSDLMDLKTQITGYPACPKIDRTIDDFKERRRFEPARIGGRVIRVANLVDGVGMDFVTNDFLQDRVHRLIVPNRGDPLYRRVSINIDCQMSGDPQLQVKGVDKIAAVVDINTVLAFCKGALNTELHYDWRSAYQESEIPSVETSVE